MDPKTSNAVVSVSYGVIGLVATLLLFKLYGAQNPLTVGAATWLINYLGGLVQVPPGHTAIPTPPSKQVD